MKSFITVTVVGLVLAAMQRRTKQSKKSMSQKRFIIKTPLSYFIFGAVETGMIAAIFIWAEFEGGLTLFLATMLLLAAIPGLLLMILPLSGIWEIQVNGDDITVIKLLVFKKHFLFSDITSCKQTRGGWKVYTQNKNRKAFFVDGMMEGSNIFMKRINKAEISVTEFKK